MTHTDLRLRADGLDFWVDVHVHRFHGSWLAVADLGGDPELGWGAAPAAAIGMALADRARPATPVRGHGSAAHGYHDVA